MEVLQVHGLHRLYRSSPAIATEESRSSSTNEQSADGEATAEERLWINLAPQFQYIHRDSLTSPNYQQQPFATSRRQCQRIGTWRQLVLSFFSSLGDPWSLKSLALSAQDCSTSKRADPRKQIYKFLEKKITVWPSWNSSKKTSIFIGKKLWGSRVVIGLLQSCRGVAGACAAPPPRGPQD